MTTILIVEDDPLNRELAEAILDAHGYDKLSVDNGEDAVRLAKSTRPDLIFMDIHMLGVDGYMALAMMRADEATRCIPVIAVTGNATHDDRLRMVANGFNDIVTKPYTIDTLLGTIEGVLNAP